MTSRPSGFKLGSDTEPDLTVASGRAGLSARDFHGNRNDVDRVAAASRRTALVSVLLFAVAASAGVFAYRDLSRKFHGLAEDRTAQIRETTARLEDRFSELSAHLAEMEKKRTAEKEPLEDTLLEFEENLARLKHDTEGAIKTINGILTEKAKQSRVDTSFKQVDADLEESRNARERIREDLTAAEEQLTSRITMLEEAVKETVTQTSKATAEISEMVQAAEDTAAAVRTEMDGLRKEVITVLGDTLDRKALAAAEERLQVKINHITELSSDHNRQLQRLASRAREMESRIRFLEKTPLGRPAPGTVLEQNIN